MSSQEYMNVWAIAEVGQGQLSPVSLELVAAARELADRMGERAEVVLLGHQVEDQAQELIRRGADLVYLADDPTLADYSTEGYLATLTALVEANRPLVLLLGDTEMGQDLAPRLAQRLGTGLISGCTRLEMDLTEWLLLGTSPAYDDRLMVTCSIPRGRPQMATLRPGAIEPFPSDDWRTGSVEKVSVERIEPVVKIVERGLEVPRPRLEEARVVVAGGRGMGGPEGFEMLGELAELLGGAVGASRGAVDERWIGEEHWVGGAGGKTVKPDLYVACGISGALQHYLGIKESRYIVAINTDERAPIMDLADVGIVGDVHEVMPVLIEELKAGHRG
ncbi:MAG: electron transfer flavoprotein subunit alpha/FixB family protein [Anaerolineae bacterium]